MLSHFKKKSIDWWILLSALLLSVISLTTMSSFESTSSFLFHSQMLRIVIALLLFFIIARLDFSFLKQSKVLLILYFVGVGLLAALFIIGTTSKGATSWFNFGFLSFQPSEFMKIILILLLAKYLARRHIEIKSIKHIFITGIYLTIPFLLILLQPDFGSAIILFAIWFGMILVAGISLKHLMALFGIGVIAMGFLWNFVFLDYQKNRIVNFFNPLSDIQNTGYNAYQSVVAVGSGKLLGKGVGYGTQSRLRFLPEYKTDFIFAAVSEEWGFVGSVLILLLFAIIILRMIFIASSVNGNFELLFSVGLVIYLVSHMIVNIGMNVGIMPVTGITLPFMSYGGSHLLMQFSALGLLMAFRRQSRMTLRDDSQEIFFH